MILGRLDSQCFILRSLIDQKAIWKLCFNWLRTLPKETSFCLKTEKLEEALASKTKIIRLLGRSEAGKTALSALLVEQYKSLVIPCLLLDGERVRQGLSQEIAFTPTDRTENHCRIIEAANISREQRSQTVDSEIGQKELIRFMLNELAKRFVHSIYRINGGNTCPIYGNKEIFSETSNSVYSFFAA